jgi:hypothetical protein
VGIHELKNFEYEEFDCQWCSKHSTGFKNMDRHFLQMLDEARSLAELKFKVLKGFVCYGCRGKINELEHSSHLIGRAAVIQCKHSYKRYRIIAALLEAGFTRIGIHNQYIYVDNDDMKADSIFPFQIIHERSIK